MTENTTNVVLPKSENKNVPFGKLTAGPIKEIFDAKGNKYEIYFPGEKKIEMKPLGKDEAYIEIPLEQNKETVREVEAEL